MGYSRPRIFVLNGSSSTSNPSDSSVYYFGSLVIGLDVGADNSRIYMPFSGVIRRAIAHCTCAAGSAEDVPMVIRKNNTTDYAIDTQTLAVAVRLFSNYSLNIPVAQGDYVNFKISTPAWATNPTSIRFGWQLVIETA